MYLKKKAVVLATLCASAFQWGVAQVSQPVLSTHLLLWSRMTNTIQIDKHWHVYSEIENRAFLKPLKEHQLLLRLMARHSFKKGVTIGAGLVGAFNYPNDPSASVFLMIPEIRGCVDLLLVHNFGRLTLSHRNVIESRFVHNATSSELTSGYRFLFRYRYRIQADVLLWKRSKQSLNLLISDEFMLQAGKSISYNIFDQNRAYIGLQYTPIKALSFEAGYLHFYQQQNVVNAFFNRHIFRFGINTFITVKKKRHHNNDAASQLSDY